MKIKSISIENIRGFLKIPEIELSPKMNILIGANNAGKSTFLKSIFMLQRNNVLTFKDLTIAETQGEVILKFTDPMKPLDVKIDYASLLFKTNTVLRSYYLPGNKSRKNLPTFPQQEPNNCIYPYLSKRKVDTYDPTVKESLVNSVTGTFKHLSLKIDRLTGYPPNQSYIDYCNEILGFVISSETKGNGKSAVYEVDTLKQIPINSMGEGIPNIVGLIADLCVAENKIFLIEEPENDVHPKALKALLKLIIEKSNTNQFFISTHSNIVMKYLGGIDEGKLFHITNENNHPTLGRLFVSEIEEINDPIQRRVVLEDLGYDLFDFDLWQAWLFLEESSAEVIVRDYLIPWHVPELANRIRTFSANSISQVIPKFDDFNRLFVYLHLEPTYKNKVWVIIDDGDEEKLIIEKLKDVYSKSGWATDNFSQFSNHDFEEYYPKSFKAKTTKVLALPVTNKKENQAKRLAKKELLDDLKVWIGKNKEKAKKEFEVSAKEVIDRLKEIQAKIGSL